MTATVPPPAPPGVEKTAQVPQLMTISVNLLPDEIVRARAASSARRLAVVAMLVVAALMGAWYVSARAQTSSAQDTLDQATAQSLAATKAQGKYADLTRTKSGITRLKGQLAGVTKGDVAWQGLTAAVRRQLPAGVLLTGVTGTATVNEQAPAAGSEAGTLVLTGDTRTELAVHQFANKLASVRGLKDPFVTSVAAGDTGKKTLTFSISITVTKDALNTRFAAKAGK